MDHPIFEHDLFKLFIEYVENAWRPATECAIIVTKNAILYPIINLWFTDYFDDVISIGPFVDIKPYGGPFELDSQTSNNEPMIEFLFLYDSIDKTKLTQTMLSLGRTDFIDLESPDRMIQ